MDSIVQSLKYGRLFSAVTAGLGASVGVATLVTSTANEWTIAAVAVLNLIAAVASIVSKLREILRNKVQ